MQHTLDYISIHHILSYRRVCKLWLEYINNLLVDAEHTICFTSRRMLSLLVNRYPQRVDNYFHICMLRNKYNLLPVLPPINIDKYVYEAVRSNHMPRLKALAATNNYFDAQSLSEYIKSIRVLRVLSASSIENAIAIQPKIDILMREERKRRLPRCLNCLIIVCLIGFMILLYSAITALFIVCRTNPTVCDYPKNE